MSIDYVPWPKVRFEEMVRILELSKEVGERRIVEFRERRAAVKQRQDFLQQRRIARLRIEGIVIDMGAVRRRCKAPKESIWYEQVDDEEEKQRLMRKRLKEMFKTQSSQPLIVERSDSSSSSESIEQQKPATKEEDKPQRGQVLRNYTKMYGVVQEKTKDISKDKEAVTKKEISKPNAEAETNKEPRENNDTKWNSPESQEKNPPAATEKESPIPKPMSHNCTSNPVSVVATKGPVPKSTRPGVSTGTEKKFGVHRFQRAVTKVTNVNKLGGEIPGRQSISPIVQKMNTRSRQSRHTSDSGSSSPGLPSISSAMGKK